MKVKKGEAVYERDSMIFDQIEYSWPVLFGLMWAAAQNSGYLKVLDLEVLWEVGTLRILIF